MLNYLSMYRKKERLTQKEFSDKLGVATSTLSKWENPDFDLRNLSVIYLQSICEILHVKIDNLIKMEEI